MKANHSFVFSLLAVIAQSVAVLSGCNDTVTSSGADPRRIDSRINIRLVVPLPDTGALELSCATARTYSCFNFHIVSELSRFGSSINTLFKEIATPNICLTALGPATCTLPLPPLSPDSYDLRFAVNNIWHTFSLEVTDSVYRVTGSDTDAVVFLQPEIRRIPRATIWGYVGYSSGSMEGTARSFLDSAQVIGCTHAALSPGNYYYFEMDDAGEPVLKGKYGYYFMHPFVFNYAGKSDQVKELVARYARTYGDSLSIAVFTAKGETFYSWILRQN